MPSRHNRRVSSANSGRRRLSRRVLSATSGRRRLSRRVLRRRGRKSSRGEKCLRSKRRARVSRRQVRHSRGGAITVFIKQDLERNQRIIEFINKMVKDHGLHGVCLQEIGKNDNCSSVGEYFKKTYPQCIYGSDKGTLTFPVSDKESLPLKDIIQVYSAHFDDLAYGIKDFSTSEDALLAQIDKFTNDATKKGVPKNESLVVVCLGDLNIWERTAREAFEGHTKCGKDTNTKHPFKLNDHEVKVINIPWQKLTTIRMTVPDKAVMDLLEEFVQQQKHNEIERSQTSIQIEHLSNEMEVLTEKKQCNLRMSNKGMEGYLCCDATIDEIDIQFNFLKLPKSNDNDYEVSLQIRMGLNFNHKPNSETLENLESRDEAPILKFQPLKRLDENGSQVSTTAITTKDGTNFFKLLPDHIRYDTLDGVVVVGKSQDTVDQVLIEMECVSNSTTCDDSILNEVKFTEGMEYTPKFKVDSDHFAYVVTFKIALSELQKRLDGQNELIEQLKLKSGGDDVELNAAMETATELTDRINKATGDGYEYVSEKWLTFNCFEDSFNSRVIQGVLKTEKNIDIEIDKTRVYI